MSLWVAITLTGLALSKLPDQKVAPLPGREEEEEGGGVCVDTFCGLVRVFEHTQAELPPVDFFPVSVCIDSTESNSSSNV